MAISFLSSQSIDGSLTVATIANETSAAGKFLVPNGDGLIKYRTAAEVLSDIGAGTVNGTGTAGTVTKWSTGGADIENGPITFSGNNSTTPGNFTLNTGTNRILSVLASTHSATVAAVATLALGYSHSGGDAFGRINLVETAQNSFDANMFFSVPHNNSLGGSTSRTALSLFGSTLGATFAGNVDVNGTEITVGTNDSIFAENNLRFKSAGAAFIDHNTVAQSIKFRLSDSSSLDVTPFEVTPSYLSSTVDMYFGGKISVAGGDITTAQVALKGQQSLLSFIRGTAGDAQFFMSADSSRLYFTHTNAQYSTNGIFKLDAGDASATFAGLVSGITPTAAANFTTKAYVDSVSGGTVGGTGVAGRVSFWNSTTDIDSNSAFLWDNTNKFLSISHWTTAAATPAVLLHLFGKDNDIDIPQIRIEGRENPGDTKMDIAVKDAFGRINLVENTGDASNGYGRMIFKSNANSNAANPSRGGFLFQLGAGTIIDALDISNTGIAAFAKDVTIGGNLEVQGGVIELLGGFTLQGTNGTYFQRIKTIDSSATSAETFSFEVKLGAAASYKKLLILNQDDTATFSGKAIAGTATVNADDTLTLATKGYVDTLVSGAVRYIGTWSAADNGSTTGGTPDLTDTNLQTPGNYYICEVAGTAEPNGTGTEPDTWAVGDWVIFSDLTSDAWQKIDNSTVLSGAGVANQVARWTDTETLSGGTGFTYAGGATGAITMGGTLSVDGNATFNGPQTIFNPDGNSQAKILNVGTDAIALYASSGDSLYLGGGGTTNLTLDASTGATFAGALSVTSNIGTGGVIILDSAKSVNFGNSNQKIVGQDSVGLKLFSNNTETLTLDNSSNATFAGNVAFPNSNLSTTAPPTNFGVYNSEIRLIDTPNGGLKPYRVITDNYGEWIQVGRFANSAMTTIQSVWSSVSPLSPGTAQGETTQFSADFGDSFPSEVRIMGATDFTKWRDTRTIDFIYGVPEGRKWKFFFSNGETTGMGVVDAVKYGWTVNGAYDGFGRWINTNLVSVRMSDTSSAIINTSAAYTTATANAFNWETNSDAKFSVSATRTFCGQDTFVTSGVGNDDNLQGFFDEYPSETNNMQGGVDFSSAVWVLIKLPQGTSSGGTLTDYWVADGNDISNTNSGSVTVNSIFNVKNHANTGSVATQFMNGKRTSGTVAVGELIFSNDNDSVATVAGFRDGANDKGSLVFQTQDGSNGFGTRLTISAAGNATFEKEITAGDDINTPTKIVIGESATPELRIKKTNTGNGKVSFYNNDGTSSTQRAYLNLDASEDFVMYGASGVGQYFYAGGVLNETKIGANSIFSGTIDVGTLTLSGSAIVADVGMTLQVDAGGVNAISIDNVGTVTTSGYLKIPNYLFHDGNTDAYLLFGTDTITLRGDSGIGFKSTATFEKAVNIAGKLTLDQGSLLNGIINTPASLRINIDSNNNNTGEKFVVGHNQDSINNNNELFVVEESGNSTFSGAVTMTGLTASTGTFSGNITAPNAGINTTLSVGTGASGTLRLQNSGTAYLTMYTSAGVAFIQGAATGNTIFFGAPASFVQNINVAGTIDGDNFKVNGTQGSSGQVLTSSGSGVSWQTPSGGGSGTIGGSGTAGFVPRFSAGTTLGNTNIQNDGTNTTINTDNAIFQITKPANASNQPTFYVDTDENRVGFRTTSPNAAFDVNGTIKTLGFNANEQQFFVDPDNQYIKAGAYGSGVFFGTSGAFNQPKYTFAAGKEGKFVEDERIETLKVSGNALDVGKTNGKGTVLLPTPGANSFYIIKEVNIYKTGTGFGVTNNVTQALAFGFCENGTASRCTMSGGSKAWLPWCTIPSNFFNGNTGAFLWQSSRGSAIRGMANYADDVATKLNRAFIMQSNSAIWTYSSNTVLYIQIKYSQVNVTAGFTNNVDRTVDDTGFTSGRTAFNAANGTVFNGVCTSTPGNPNANTFYFVNTSSNAQQSYPCNGDTVYTTQTGTTLLPSFYYYLYSAGGSRFYIQVINGIVSNQSGCTVQICSPPI